MCVGARAGDAYGLEQTDGSLMAIRDPLTGTGRRPHHAFLDTHLLHQYRSQVRKHDVQNLVTHSGRCQESDPPSPGHENPASPNFTHPHHPRETSRTPQFAKPWPLLRVAAATWLPVAADGRHVSRHAVGLGLALCLLGGALVVGRPNPAHRRR